MPNQRLFRLTVDDLTASGRFNLRLTDGQGRFLAAHEVKANTVDARWRGLFEMDEYLEKEQGRGKTDQELLAELGDFLRTEVLGTKIAGEIFKSRSPGTIFVELPRERRPESIELTRIPWELARDERGQTLPDVSLAVQVLPSGAMPDDASLERDLTNPRPFELDGPLRVLLAFAQSRGQTALAMRAMRERLRTFFLKELAPRYQVELEVLQYGVTQEALQRAARQGGGYHIVHLFAHGHEDLLVLEDDEGQDDRVSGEKVADLLSGDFAAPPHLVFLTACHSGEVKVQREIAALWQALRQVEGLMEAAEEDSDFWEMLKDFPSYTGTALAMLRAEVPQVLAMRYTVEEKFAFDLAETFYRHVLLDKTPPALALGRFRAEARREGDKRGYRPHDWATPAFFGGAQGAQPILLTRGRSEAADRLWVRGRLPDELRRATLFVGRTDELRNLRKHLFGEESDHAVALLWGVGGLGKTALAAEAVHLWHADFDFVLGVRPPAADQPLSLNAWLREVNYHVMTDLGVQGYRIWDEQGGLTRDQWLASRLDELVRFLNRYRLLLVIDNFEPNLRSEGEEGEVRYVCSDPYWGTTLTRLARDMSPGMSCLLVTSRRAPDELARQPEALNLPVGPLNRGEWWVFARTAENFRRLFLGDEADRELLLRALSVARGHPLILHALEQLAVDPEELARRLEEFEARGGRYAGMADLFATSSTPEEREREMAYFEDIAAHSVRALIEDRVPAAQRLLRVVTLALETVDDGQIKTIWEDEIWPEKMPRLQPQGQDWQKLWDELLDAGLLTPEQKMSIRADGQTVETTTYVWHPIVTEQATEVLPDGEEFPEADYLRRYVGIHLDIFRRLRQPQNRTQAQMAIEAARLAIRYLMQLGDAEIAAMLIDKTHHLSQTSDFRRDLQSWINELLERAPPGKLREALLRCLADVYVAEGRPQAATHLYRQALESAEEREDWRSCGLTSHQLGLALMYAANYPAARAAYRAALRYGRRAGKTIPGRLISLGELVRLLVIQGDISRARRHAARLVTIARAYYERRQNAPSAVAEPVGMLIGVLDIQRMVEVADENWSAAIRICDGQIELDQRHHKGDLAVATHVFNRAAVLNNLGRLDDAERDLLFCLRVFHEHQQPLQQAAVFGELANVADGRGDQTRAVQFQTQALDIRHRLGALSNAAISHCNLGGYLSKLGRTDEAILEGCCAALIYALIGERQGLHNALRYVSIYLSQFPASARRSHLPSASDLFATYPRLGELLAQRGVTVESAQEELEQLWEMLER